MVISHANLVQYYFFAQTKIPDWAFHPTEKHAFGKMYVK